MSVSDGSSVLRKFWPVGGASHLAGMICIQCLSLILGQWLGIAYGKQGLGMSLWWIQSTAAGTSCHLPLRQQET